MPNSRYDYTKSKKVNKKSVFKPTLYPKIPLRDDDIYIFSRESEKLEHISYRFYGTPEYWWVIAKANGVGKRGFGIDKNLKVVRIPHKIDYQKS